MNGPEYLYNTSQEMVENIFKADLEYEREKRKELERRLDAKDNQVKGRRIWNGGWTAKTAR